MRKDSVIFEINWTVPLYDIVEGLLEDRDITAEQLARLTGIPLSDLVAFLSGMVADLSPAQYQLIETKLNLPTDYFARCKAFNQERADRLGLKQAM